MRKFSLKLLSFIFVLALLFVFPQLAFAHSDDPRLEISVERINPGGSVEIRGVDFDVEESVTLSLISTNTEIPLNEVTADVEGVFTQSIVLPSDLPAGVYNFQAKTDHEEVVSPALTVWGVAVEDQESNVIQDQSDVQFEPMPMPIVGVTTALPQAALQENNAPHQNAPSPLLWFAVSIAIIILSSILLRFRFKK